MIQTWQRPIIAWRAEKRYSEDQPRDDHGRWSEEGGGASGSADTIKGSDGKVMRVGDLIADKDFHYGNLKAINGTELTVVVGDKTETWSASKARLSMQDKPPVGWKFQALPGGDKNTYYHGTVLPSAQKILADGLQQDKSQVFKLEIPNDDPYKDGKTFTSERGYVFMTTDSKLAQSYALFRDDYAKAKPGSQVVLHKPTSDVDFWKPDDAPKTALGRAAIVELKLPSDVAKRLERDPSESNKDAFRTTGVIPSKYISAVDLMQSDGSWKRIPRPEDGKWALRNTAADISVYLVYYGDLDGLGTHLNASTDKPDEVKRMAERTVLIIGDDAWRREAIRRLLEHGLPDNVSVRYSDEQPRDEHGRWTSGGATGDLKAGQSTEDRYKSGGKWDADRAKMHEDIISKALAGKVPPEGRAPVATLLGGGTATGKTSASRVILGNDPNVLRLDPDEVKLQIPEFAGLKAADPQNAAMLVHEESSYLTKQILAQAAAKGLDLTYDATTSGNGGPATAKLLANQGYDVHAKFMDVPIDVARERSARRAATSTDPINRGRIVPDHVIRENHQGAARNFVTMKDMPEIKSKQMYDNTDKSPRLIYDRQGTGDATIHDMDRWNQYQAKAEGRG